MTFDKPCTGFQALSVKAYQAPQIRDADPGGLKSPVLDALDAIAFQSQSDSSALLEIPANLNILAVKDKEFPNRIHYRIDTHGSIPDSVGPFAIVAEFKTTWDVGTFDVKPGDPNTFYMTCDFPCYRYRLAIETEPTCKACLSDVTTEALCGSDPHWGERDRLQRALSFDSAKPDGIRCELLCPFPGTRYYLKWKNNYAEQIAQSPDQPTSERFYG